MTFLTTKPGFVLDVLRQGAKVGQPIIMFQSSNADPAEDFTVSLQGTVNEFAGAGLLPSGALTLHYGDDIAWEIEYSPNGVDSGLCVGIAGLTAANNDQGHPSALRRVGQDRVDHGRPEHPARRRFTFPFVPLINGAGTNFSHPYVLTYPQNGNPNDKPRPQLVTQTLHQFSRGQVYDNQLWSAFFGVLR